MPIVFDTGPICDWARRALRSTADEIPDSTLTPFMTVPLIRFRNLNAAFATAVGADFSGVIAFSDIDTSLFNEALGWAIAARWIMLPKTDDDRVVIRAKVSELEVVYQVQQPEQFAALFMGESLTSFYNLSMVWPTIQAIVQQFGGGLANLYNASPAQVAEDAEITRIHTYRIQPFFDYASASLLNGDWGIWFIP